MSVVAETPIDSLFTGSNGHYYTGRQIRRRLRSGPWKLCLRQWSPDRWLVELPSETLLLLTPVEPEELPRWIEIRIDGSTVRIVDTRRSTPSTHR